MPEPICRVCGGHPSISHTGPGITINRNPGGSGMNSQTRIYTTAARDRIVEEGDPEAAFLVAGAGGEVPNEYLHIYRDYRKAKDEPAKVEAIAELEPEEQEPEAKAVEKPPENKARGRAEAK